MATLYQPRSIHDSRPNEYGGVVARTGFEFQDHIAVGLCLEMAVNPNLLEVWCEAFDDITLIWTDPAGQVVEFVQVKSNQIPQWSAAALCPKRPGKQANTPNGTQPAGSTGSNENSPTSLLETSLNHDCYIETPRFRVVTATQVAPPLRLLLLELNHRDRDPNGDGFRALVEIIGNQEPKLISPNGNDFVFWLQNAQWYVMGNIAAVANQNRLTLQAFAEMRGPSISLNALEELYNRLLGRVKSASDAPWSPDEELKKLRKAEFLAWLTGQLREVSQASPQGTTEKLRSKMTAASISPEDVETAVELRRLYVQDVRSSTSYLDLGDRELVEGKILLKLTKLRQQLYSGELPNEGIQFHRACVNAMEELHADSADDLPEYYYAGCMYEVTNRCMHRFSQSST